MNTRIVNRSDVKSAQVRASNGATPNSSDFIKKNLHPSRSWRTWGKSYGIKSEPRVFICG